MALTIKTEALDKPKEFVPLSKWIDMFRSFQSHGFIPRRDKQPWQDFKVKQRSDVQPVSRRRGGCMLLAGQSQAEN